MSGTFVVVGANLAGGRAAEALRELGFDGRVVLVGEEADRPYERPPLSKAYLRGGEAPFLRSTDWYEEQGIELRLGTRVQSLDPAGSVRLDDGSVAAFDRCLLATGARPRRLAVAGSDLEGVLYLRTLRDAEELAGRLAERPRVVVVGAGFIGAEVAASARQAGCAVTMIEIADVPLGRVLGRDLGQMFAEVHRDHGVDLRLGEGVERLEGSGHVAAVVGSSGRPYPADLVVVGVGVVPNEELAREAGLRCDDGVVVDEFCRTSAERVYAAGDVARRPDAHSGRPIRVEHFQNAQDGGRAAAANMLGREEPFRQVPWFWSDQYDLNLQMLGHPQAGHRRVLRGSVADRELTALYLEGGRVRAAVSVNRPADVGAARRLIERRVAVDPDRAADPDTSLRDLLRG